MANKPLCLTTPITQRRARLGVTRAAFSRLVGIDLYRLGRLERGTHAPTPDELARMNAVLKSLEQAHADIRETFAFAVPA